MEGSKPITDRQRELLGMASIASQMPVEFPTGVCWTEFRGECKFCRGDIPDSHLRGQVTRPMPSVAIVEAIGVCPSCKMATPFLCRLYDDWRFSNLFDGRWCTWRPSPSLWDRLKRLFGLSRRA